MKKLVLATVFMAIAIPSATSVAWAQAYGYWGVPYDYGAGIYGYSGPYAPAPYAAPPGLYGYDPHGTNWWDYYRVDRPGRGNNVESTR